MIDTQTTDDLAKALIQYCILTMPLSTWREAIDELDEAHKQKMARIWYTVELPYGEVGYENE